MTQARILVVEDDSLVALNLQHQLEYLGYSVAGRASSGGEAIDRAEATEPDLVLMDIKLGGRMDGVETADEIRSRLDIPVVYLTGYSDETTLDRVKASEPFGYLLKPFDTRDLRVAIEMALYKHAAEQRLREYAAALEVRNRELDAFAQTVAHDLKDSLGTILGFAALLQTERATLPPEDIELCANSIVTSGWKMNNVIDELLLLAEVRKGEVQPEPLDMASIVQAAQRRLRPTIERQRAEIEVPGSWPVALGYAPWVEEVWTNYLSNALKYGGDPPHVELGTELGPRAGLSNDTARFWVRDDGPGLTEEEQERLFVPFTRLDQARAQGHGLGLSIVRRIVERLGGAVGVESEPGEGSLFYFDLPLAEKDLER